MKKTFSANINGRIFNIDEDAYSLLQNYLHQLHDTFGGDEGREIVGDIEARIAELFDERVASGASVIVLMDVNRVIETMGRPEDLSESSPADPDVHTSGNATAEEPPVISINLPGHKRLFRNMQNRVLGGVVSGLGTYLGWEIWVMRLALLVLALFTYFWPLTIVYMVAWMVIPAARTPRQILEMHGEPVNVETVGQTILKQQPTPPPYQGTEEGMTARMAEIQSRNRGDGLSTIMRAIANCIAGFFGFLSAIACLGIGISIIALIAWMIGLNVAPDVIPSGLPYESPILAGMTALCALCFILIPCIGITWGAASMVLNAPGAGKKTVISLVVLDMLMLVLTIVLGMILASMS
ncbi:MAG: PspC domain-containing protein [Muribaculaceae bacterium]|nr:PspC domain-containing protein [Muribaculaceae bacterium]